MASCPNYLKDIACDGLALKLAIDGFIELISTSFTKMKVRIYVDSFSIYIFKYRLGLTRLSVCLFVNAWMWECKNYDNSHDHILKKKLYFYFNFTFSCLVKHAVYVCGSCCSKNVKNSIASSWLPDFKSSLLLKVPTKFRNLVRL